MPPELPRAPRCKDYTRPILSSLKAKSNQSQPRMRLAKDAEARAILKLLFLVIKYIHQPHKLRVLYSVMFGSYKSLSDRTEPSRHHLRSRSKELVPSMIHLLLHAPLRCCVTPCAGCPAKYLPGCGLSGINIKSPVQSHH